MYELLGERTAADNEKPTKKKEKKEKPAAKAEVIGTFCNVFSFVFISSSYLWHICRKRKLL